MKNNNANAVGGVAKLHEHASWVEKYWILKSSNYIYQNTLVGVCIFIEKSFFLKVNGFDETLSAGEDSNLSNKIQLNGGSFHMDGRLNVIHLGFPTSISSFIKRQAWHSSEYAYRLSSLFVDKIFLLTIAFLTGVVLLPLALYSLDSSFIIVVITLMLLPVIVLGIKRMIRFNSLFLNPFKFFMVFLIDCLYLIGRSIGFTKGMYYRFIKRQHPKHFK